ALQLAEACGVVAHPVLPRDLPLVEPYDAVLCDLDSLPAPQRDEILTGLTANVSSQAVAVHSYNLEGDLIKTLRKQKVAVYPRLEEKAFQNLRRRFARRGQRGVRIVAETRCPPPGNSTSHGETEVALAWGDPNMGSEQQARWIWVLGVAVA